MATEAKAYSDTLQFLLDLARQEVKALPPEALNWKPLAKDTNSAAGLIGHMCSSTDVLICHCLTGAEVTRPQDPFGQTARSASELLSMIDKAEAQSKKALESVTTRSLAALFALPGREPQSKRAWVQRGLAHLGDHVGHLQITRQLWEAQQK
ncbi:MAG: DinB family protein [Chloroflexi bacterium]|nr:DinB family protein [Chloroflexota bacterium]